jgi:hypothetical protein
MFTENMSPQDWRMAAMLQMNANFVRKQKEEAEQGRHRQLLEEQKRASEKLVAEQAAARRTAEQQLSETREHNNQLLEQNRIANIQHTILKALPMVSEKDRFSFITGRLEEFVDPPLLTFESLDSYLGDLSWEFPEWETFQKTPAKEIVKAMIVESDFSDNIEEVQNFLPPQFKISAEMWAEEFIDQRTVDMVRLLQLDYSSASACEKLKLDCPLWRLSWPISSYWCAPEFLLDPIAYLAIIISVWNDNEISESELVKMMKILKGWQPSLTDDAAYSLLQNSIENYNADLKSQSHDRIEQIINKICTCAHPEQASWIFTQLEDLAGVDMVATEKQQDFLKQIKSNFEAVQNKKRELSEKLEKIAADFQRRFPPLPPKISLPVLPPQRWT